MTDQGYWNGYGADVVLPIDDRYGWTKIPGCLVRMRMFDPQWQYDIGARNGDRIVNIDVDTVSTGPLDELFDRGNEFTIMQGFNTTNPCPFNGSLWMLQAGKRHDVWDDLTLSAANAMPFHSIPDDQGWLHSRFPNAAKWTTADGVYCFKKEGWPGRRKLPEGARLVAFPGRDPAKYVDQPWIKQHWIGRD